MRPRRFVRQLDSLRTQRLAWQSEVIRAPAPSCDKRELLSLLRDPLIDQEHRSTWLPARRCSATHQQITSAGSLFAQYRVEKPQETHGERPWWTSWQRQAGRLLFGRSPSFHFVRREQMKQSQPQRATVPPRILQ